MRALLTGVLGALVLAAPAAASPDQESTFQDDNLLVYAAPQDVGKALDTMKALGADRIRVSVFWKIVAPSPATKTRPADFEASDPAAYPAGAWDRYDTIVREAEARNLGINFNLTDPAPIWATGSPERKDIEETFDPKAAEFGSFVRAVATRYSGGYVPPDASVPLPRVRYWSIWNEPNHPGWLDPQWATDPRDPKKWIETSPQIYRGLVDAAYSALVGTGHATDTILIGETAPKGLNVQGTTRGIKPGRFIRSLYCVDQNLQFLTGADAQLLGCPTENQGAAFTAAHPGLFNATGYAHHPYELIFPPARKPTDPDYFTIANLGQLGGLLRRIRTRYQQADTMPLYLTEFGYQTNPPDPLGVTPRQQASYLNEAEYLAYRNPKVRTLSQFLLVDDQPVPDVPRSSTAAWLTFQSGLENLDGSLKPAFHTYAFPAFLPQTKIRRGHKLHVWGLLRVAANDSAQTVQVLWRARGSKKAAKSIATLTTKPHRGYVDAQVRVRGSGTIQLLWSSDGQERRSRLMSFTVRKKG